MKKFLSIFSLILVLTFSLVSCEKKTEDFNSDKLEEYVPTEVGKYIRYRLDSVLYVNFGQKDSTVYYQAKDVVEEAFKDDKDRTSLRVVRYLRDTLETQAWVPTMTYVITPDRNKVEVVENNLRFIKLILPLTEGSSWKGNTYVNLNSTDPAWDFDYLFDWDYTYENMGSDFTVFGGKSIPNTVTINQRDEVIGIPTDPNGYSERNFSVEVYAKGIGLVSKNFLHTEYQPGNPGYTNGYGIRMKMIDHH